MDEALDAFRSVSFSLGAAINSYPSSLERQLEELQNLGLDNIDIEAFRTVVRLPDWRCTCMSSVQW